MPLPVFLQSGQVPVGALAPAGPPGPGAGPPALDGAPLSGNIPLVMQTQEQTNWCWAAVSSSVSRFFAGTSTWTQCKVAEGTLGINGCCGNPPATGCDVPHYLDRALTTTGNFVTWAGPPTNSDIAAEIATNNRPLCLRVEWSGGPSGHFIAVAGFAFQPPNDFVDIEDPAYGPSTVTTASLESGSYQLAGKWTHSFFTNP